MKNLIVSNILNYYVFFAKRGNLSYPLIKKIPESWLVDFQKKTTNKNDIVAKNLVDYAFLLNDDYLFDFCIKNNFDVECGGQSRSGIIRKLNKIIYNDNLDGLDDFFSFILKIEDKLNKKLKLSIGNSLLVEKVSSFDFFKDDSKFEKVSDLILFMAKRNSLEEVSFHADFFLKMIVVGHKKLKDYLKENLSEKNISNLLNVALSENKSFGLFAPFQNKEGIDIEIVKFLLSCDNFNKNVIQEENCYSIDLAGIFYFSLDAATKNEKIYNKILVDIVNEHLNVLENHSNLQSSFKVINKKNNFKI